MSGINTGIYIRVSTEEQALHGFSIRAQEEKLKFYAEKIKAWNIYDIYIDEGISGKNITDRPEINRMISDIKKGLVKNVLVFKIDRLTRSTKDLIDLIDFFNKNNCDFNSLNESIDTSTATGRMFIKIIGIFAEFERENIAERVSLGIERKAREGYSICSSCAPYGYNRLKGCNNLSINYEESKVVKKIFSMFIDNKSIPDIVNYLNDNKIKSKKNTKWSYKCVSQIIKNPTYIGKIRFGINKKKYFETDGNHEKIITEATFFEANKRFKSHNYNDAYYKFFLKCSCGNHVVPKRIYKKNKAGCVNVYINYRCSKKKCGCDKDISHRKVNKLISNAFPEINSVSEEKKFIYLKENKISFYIKNNTIISL